MKLVIIGGGQAAISAATKARALNNDCEIVIYSEETFLPYQRPPLSKKYLYGDMEEARLYFRPQKWYDDNRIDIQTNCKVTKIDRKQNTITVGGEVIYYDKMIIATGARPRLLPNEISQDASNIYAIRNLIDIKNIKPKFQNGANLLIIGGGYIGLEAASVARKFNLNVTLIESAPRILMRVACEETSEYFRQLHNTHDVKILENSQLEQFTFQDNRVVSATLSNGQSIDTDFVITGIGVIPNLEIAEASGIACDQGILVNENTMTNDTNIFAAGDVAKFNFRGNHIRLESVQNAIDQGEIAAENALGMDVRYEPKPWFWSDQYDMSLQIAGWNGGYDDVITRKTDDPQKVSHWYFADDKLIAVDVMAEPRTYMIAKRIIEAGKNIPKNVISDIAHDLKQYM